MIEAIKTSPWWSWSNIYDLFENNVLVAKTKSNWRDFEILIGPEKLLFSSRGVYINGKYHVRNVLMKGSTELIKSENRRILGLAKISFDFEGKSYLMTYGWPPIEGLVYANNELKGKIYPKSKFVHKYSLDLPNDFPLLLKIFLFMIFRGFNGN